MAVNIAQLFTPHRATPGRILYRHHEGRGWTDVTAGEVAREIARWQAAFRREGLVRGERIALCVRNGVGWVAIDLAALGMGLVVVPLYVDDNADNMAWCVAHAEARLLIVESTRIAASLAQLADREHPLPPVVIVRPDEGERGVTAASFLPPAADADGFVVEELPPDTLATICFTSGTAGRPKGVMLSHGNILANARQCAADRDGARRRSLPVGPAAVAHVRAHRRLLPAAGHRRAAWPTAAASRTSPRTSHSQAPTAMFAVPRIFERFHARIEHALASSPVKRFAARAVRRARLSRGARARRAPSTACWRRRCVAWSATPILARLGGRMRLAVVGGAALDPALAHAFIGLGLPMLQGYGMTEASPVISVNRDDDNVPESVGAPLHGVEVKLAAGGELLARGANVMLGYWNNPDATRAALTPDGWLRTGDVAEIIDGKIYIRGRAKDILVLSNGEKLPPQDVEFAILRDPVFEQVMLVGEGRPFIVLLAVTRETDEKALIQRANEQLEGISALGARAARRGHARSRGASTTACSRPTLKLKRPLLLEEAVARDRGGLHRADALAPASRGDRGDDEGGREIRRGVHRLAQQPCRREDREERLQQLELPDGRDAAERQPAIPGEEAEEHGDRGDVREAGPRRPRRGGQARVGGKPRRNNQERRRQHEHPRDHLPAAEDARKPGAFRVTDGGGDHRADEQQVRRLRRAAAFPERERDRRPRCPRPRTARSRAMAARARSTRRPARWREAAGPRRRRRARRGPRASQVRKAPASRRRRRLPPRQGAATTTAPATASALRRALRPRARPRPARGRGPRTPGRGGRPQCGWQAASR